MTTELPFAVAPFTNTSGTISFRVSGSWDGRRTRKNFPDRASADAFCNSKNAEALKAKGAAATILVQTRLTEEQVRAAEAAVDKAAGRWQLRRILDEGIARLEAQPVSQLVSPLAEEWFILVESEMGARWFADCRARVRRFTKDHPKLMTGDWDVAVTRSWLDGLGLGKQTRANMRNALHRFGGWLIERGFKKENPAAGIRITGRLTGAQLAERPLPSIFTPLQTEALVRACELGACRRLLGWMTACLFIGLRPESEAPRATWPEVRLESAEFSALGRKRGAKLRIIPLQPAALAFLTVVKADKMERPAAPSTRLRRKAVELANEWLTENHPAEKPIVWDEDITRHTFASYRSPQIPVHKLAEEMGTSVPMIYSHYRHPPHAAAVAAFWAIRPA